MNETEKRRELQLMLLREGYTQDQAREMAADLVTERLDAELEKWREHAMQFPERQILPPGAIDLADVKNQREEALGQAEEAEYYENRAKLAALMAQLFSLSDMPTAVLQALLDALETNGIDRLEAMTDITKTIDSLRMIVEYERKADGSKG